MDRRQQILRRLKKLRAKRAGKKYSISKTKKHEYYLKWYRKKFHRTPGKGRHKKRSKGTYKLSAAKKHKYYLKWYRKKFHRTPKKRR